jgi:hypothetical protein
MAPRGVGAGWERRDGGPVTRPDLDRSYVNLASRMVGCPTIAGSGYLCEGYTLGMTIVIENVRQLRHQADDSCPGAARGEHTYNYP